MCFSLGLLNTRRVRRRILAGLALGLLSWMLLLMAAEVHEPLHRWVHGGVIPDDDDCAVVLLATGKASVSATAATVIPVLVVMVALLPTFVLPLVLKLPLPPGRAPPSYSFSALT